MITVIGITLKYMFGAWPWLTALAGAAGLFVGCAATSRSLRWGSIGSFAILCIFLHLRKMNQVNISVDDTSLLIVVGTWTAWFALWLALGLWIRRMSGGVDITAPQAITDPELLEAVAHVASLPAFAAMPWFARVWTEKTKDEKAAWIAQHREALRQFVIRHGGLSSTPAADFVVEVQRLDRQP